MNLKNTFGYSFVVKNFSHKFVVKIINNEIVAKMKQTWISPRIIIGPTATGDYYYHRPNIAEAIWSEILKGSHVLIAAPRRVGKSSVMIYMADHCPENTKGIFKVIQGVTSDEQFYAFIYDLMRDCLGKFQKMAEWLKEDADLRKFGPSGIELGEGRKIDYLKEINKLLPKIASKKVKIVLFLDELPEVLHYLYTYNKKEQASALLDNLRGWRLNWRENFNFVLAGSVGIHHIVQKHEGRTADLNDLREVVFEAFTIEEAYDYIGWATKNASVQYDDTLKKYLLSKINFYLPYFINLMLDEIDKSAVRTNNRNITTQDIDTAFEQNVKHSDHFKEWKARLYDYFARDDADFLNEVLTYLSHKETINKRKLYDLAVKHNKQNSYVDLVDGLETDGYIIEQADNYVFVSPFLQAYWKRQNEYYDAR